MINLFKQKEGFSYSSFSGSFIPDEIKDDLVQVEESVYEDLKEQKLMWKNYKLVSNPNYEALVEEESKRDTIAEIQTQIDNYKRLLFESDYRAIKYAEGYYTEEEYAPYRAERQLYRDEINALEAELKKLGGE